MKKRGLSVADLQKQVADQIIDMMQQDGIEWVTRWRTPRPPCNGISGHTYRGGNIFTTSIAMMLLETDDPRFIPRSQLFNTDTPVGKVRKGEKGTPIVFYGAGKREDKNTGEETSFRFGKIYHCWNVSQLDDVDEERLIPLSAMPEPASAGERDAALDLYIANTEAKLNLTAAAAFYHPASDTVHMPPLEVFYAVKGITATEYWYSTMLHELVHWTGAKHRLDRDKKYHTKEGRAFEELIAEIGSVIAGVQLGVQPAPREDNAAYVQSWIRHLQDRPNSIFEAASAASAAVQLMNDCQENIDVIEEEAA